jgi:hypothetical protein
MEPYLTMSKYHNRVPRYITLVPNTTINHATPAPIADMSSPQTGAQIAVFSARLTWLSQLEASYLLESAFPLYSSLQHRAALEDGKTCSELWQHYSLQKNWNPAFGISEAFTHQKPALSVPQLRMYHATDIVQHVDHLALQGTPSVIDKDSAAYNRAGRVVRIRRVDSTIEDIVVCDQPRYDGCLGVGYADRSSNGLNGYIFIHLMDSTPHALISTTAQTYDGRKRAVDGTLPTQFVNKPRDVKFLDGKVRRAVVCDGINCAECVKFGA